MRHPPFMFFHSSFISMWDTLNFLHHHELVTLGGFLHSLTDGISFLLLVFSDCNLELMILLE